MSDPRKKTNDPVDLDLGNEAGSRAMDAALQSSFTILKLVIAVLVVYLVLSATQSVTKLVALAWISSNFLAYRFGLYMVGFKGWCSCLGTLTKQLPVSPETAEAIMLTIAVFVFIGSCYYLLPYVKSRTMSQES